MLSRYGFADASGRSIPLRPKSTIASYDLEDPSGFISPEEQDATAIPIYRRMIGSLMCLTTTTRPDIAFVVRRLAQFVTNPQRHHWRYLGDVLRYLKETARMGILVCPRNNQLEIYADADFLGDFDHGYSTSGVMVMLGGVPLSWCSVKQSIVAWSTADAEYQALAEGVREGNYAVRLINSLGFSVKNPVLKCDNSAAVSISRSRVDSRKGKYLRARFHVVRASLRDGEFTLVQVQSQKNYADILTKAVSRERFIDLTKSWLVTEEECDKIEIGTI